MAYCPTAPVIGRTRHRALPQACQPLPAAAQAPGMPAAAPASLCLAICSACDHMQWTTLVSFDCTSPSGSAGLGVQISIPTAHRRSCLAQPITAHKIVDWCAGYAHMAAPCPAIIWACQHKTTRMTRVSPYFSLFRSSSSPVTSYRCM